MFINSSCGSRFTLKSKVTPKPGVYNQIGMASDQYSTRSISEFLPGVQSLDHMDQILPSDVPDIFEILSFLLTRQ